MKRVKLILFLSLLPLMFAGFVYASVPNQITYSGSLRSYGQPVNGTKSVTFNIYSAETGGTASWSRGQLQVTVSSGTFSHNLTPNIDWRGKGFWLELIVGDKILSPRTKLTAQVYAFHSRTAEDIEKSTGNSIHFAIGSSTHMVINSSGYVGIGTANPQYQLDSAGSIHMASGSLYFSDGSSMNSANIGSAGAISHNSDALITGDANADGTGKIALNIASVEKLTLLNNGNVGIGNTSPQYNLDTSGSIRIGSGGLYFPDGTYISSTGTISNLINRSSNVSITADADSNASGKIQLNIVPNEKMVLLNSGYVGVGTTKTGYPLECNGSIKISAGSGGKIVFAGRL